MSKVLRISVFCALSLIFIFGFLYSARIQSLTGMGDLRSRVVGARHIKDGHSPYFTIWYPGDSLRYFSGMYVDSPRVRETEIANLTASPAVLRGMTLFADHDQYQIDWGVFIVFYLFFLISVALALYYSPPGRRLLSLILLIPFVITDGWIYHFYQVQQYILYGFLITLVSVLLLRQRQWAAGICMALVFVCRLNTVLLAVPFLLAFISYRKFLITAMAGVLLYASFAFFNPLEKKLWQDYFASLKVHQAHQMIQNTPAIEGNLYVYPLLPHNFEGTDYVKLDSLWQRENVVINKESSNFKNVYEVITGKYPSVAALQIMLALSVLVIMALLMVQKRRRNEMTIPVHKLVLTGLLCYFLSNFFSTVSTAPYHLPQWWSVAVVFAICSAIVPRISIILFLAGIFINIHYLPDFRGKHFLAELFLLLSVFSALVLPQREAAPLHRFANGAG